MTFKATVKIDTAKVEEKVFKITSYIEEILETLFLTRWSKNKKPKCPICGSNNIENIRIVPNYIIETRICSYGFRCQNCKHEQILDFRWDCSNAIPRNS